MGIKALLVPPFSDPDSRPFFHFIRSYNRRFVQIARRRRRLGTIGKTNRGRRYLIPGFTLKPTDVGLMVKAMFKWLWLELTEGWHTWFEHEASQPNRKPAWFEVRKRRKNVRLSTRQSINLARCEFPHHDRPMAAFVLCCPWLVWIRRARTAALWIG